MIISQADAAGAPRFFLHDGHGSTRALLDGLTVLERYAYDAFGEAIGFEASSAATTWLFAGDGQTTYEYSDPATPGVNDWTVQTKKTVTGEVNETHVYEYNNQGRLSRTEVTKGGSTTITAYEYNDNGVRVRQENIDPADGTTVLSTTEYLVDGQNQTGYAKPIEERVGGSLERTYTLGHQILTQAASGGVRHFLHDGHGSTRALLNASAVVVEPYRYDAFGEAIGSTPRPRLRHGCSRATASTTRPGT